MRWFPSDGVHCGGAEAVPVLVGMFPLEIHRLAFEQLSESTRYLNDFTRAYGRPLEVVPEMGEVGETAPRRIGAINDSPALFSIPDSHRARGTHVYQRSRGSIADQPDSSRHA
jgi:hypothetical protein